MRSSCREIRGGPVKAAHSTAEASRGVGTGCCHTSTAAAANCTTWASACTGQAGRDLVHGLTLSRGFADTLRRSPQPRQRPCKMPSGSKFKIWHFLYNALSLSFPPTPFKSFLTIYVTKDISAICHFHSFLLPMSVITTPHFLHHSF